MTCIVFNLRRSILGKKKLGFHIGLRFVLRTSRMEFGVRTLAFLD